jgi:hypothetical protein
VPNRIKKKRPQREGKLKPSNRTPDGGGRRLQSAACARHRQAQTSPSCLLLNRSSVVARTRISKPHVVLARYYAGQAGNGWCGLRHGLDGIWAGCSRDHRCELTTSIILGPLLDRPPRLVAHRPIVSQVEIRAEYPLRRGTMAERTANIVYWFCCVVAAISVAIGISVWFLNFRQGTTMYSLLAVSFMVALLVWIFGRAIRYVLAGT